ncbi:nuclear transport factor 2 family protein [Nocardioides sp.]|uniref:nuclear transport factor 2 family protein n=1 Tax=Nocardioides sp. TaxID=35761 RepID=UPI002734C089|nr:nuclear transport factor 2 family protein [Nocardioides sp.]MDP3889647.1 nuclear transport factor 2 family protein [Nocardioides sp.]
MSDRRLQDLLDKQEIHELVLRYCRGVDRKDPDLLRSLYTRDAADHHGTVFSGSAEDYIGFLEESLEFIRIGAHYVCNHLVVVEGDHAYGEVYALGYHVLPGHGPDGPDTESFVGVRYLDRYRREDECWRFEHREVVFDLDRTRPVDHRGAPGGPPADDPSYSLAAPLFRRHTP